MYDPLIGETSSFYEKSYLENGIRITVLCGSVNQCCQTPNLYPTLSPRILTQMHHQKLW